METPERKDAREHRTQLSRRTFLQASGAAAGVAAAAGLEGILAARRAPAYAQGTRLHLLRWNDFIPACDVILRQQLLPEANKLLGADVQMETINANDLQPRITAAIQSGSGADIVMTLHNWPHLYKSGAVDVADLAEWQAKDQGGFYAQSEQAVKEGKSYLALPWSISGLLIAYRKSWFNEVGVTAPPKTLEEYRQLGMKLKKKGHPIGQTLGHTFGDAPAWSYPMLWNFGAAERDKASKVVLDSKETVESVKWMTAFWKDACDEGGFAWDDTNNNRAFLAGEISATLNGASIYIAAKRGQDKIKDEKGEAMWRDIDHFPIPNGPAGSWGYHIPFSHMVMKYGKNQKLAKDFLRWLHGKETFQKWFEVAEGFSVGSTKHWEQSPMWGKLDDAMKLYRTAAQASRIVGYAGPPDAKASEVYSKYIITDMYAKAAQGTPAEEAVKWAAAELKRIYG
jgi:multiple sugar transport system substrate-binding protein